MNHIVELVRDRARKDGMASVARDLGSNRPAVSSWLAGLCRPATAAWLEAKAREVYGEVLDKAVGQ